MVGTSKGISRRVGHPSVQVYQIPRPPCDCFIHHCQCNAYIYILSRCYVQLLKKSTPSALFFLHLKNTTQYLVLYAFRSSSSTLKMAAYVDDSTQLISMFETEFGTSSSAKPKSAACAKVLSGSTLKSLKCLKWVELDAPETLLDLPYGLPTPPYILILSVCFLMLITMLLIPTLIVLRRLKILKIL